jgi:DNA-binding transcriptional LysR family regulator
MPADLHSLEVLVAVQRLGSFAAAAREMKLTRAAIARTVARLEKEVGVRLCQRTTRRVVLTEQGNQLAHRVANGLRSISEALAVAHEDLESLSGSVRLTVSHAFGRYLILPWLTEFLQRHPAVHVEMALTEQMEDLWARSIDLAVRIGPLAPSPLIARHVGNLRLSLVAGRELVERLGRPQDVSELSNWPVIAFRIPGTSTRYPWTFHRGDTLTPFVPEKPVVEVDSVEAARDLALAQTGIALLPDYLVHQDIDNGVLIRLLPDLVAEGPEVHLCYSEREFMPQRVKVMLRELLEYLRASPAF